MSKQAYISDSELFEGQSVPKTILKFAVPTVLSQLVVLIYNLADTFFVGHTNDPAQIAALTLSFPLFMQLTMIANLFGIGANSLMSRSLGAGDRDKAKRTSAFAFWASLIITVVYMAILGGFMPQILHAIGALTEETFRATRAYLTWTVLIGGLPTTAGMMLGHMIRAEGNTKQASIGMSLGGILNILLDPVFVQGMHMGARGAGIATAISNFLGMCYLLYVVYRTKHSVVDLHPKHFRIEGVITKEVLLVGFPAALMVVFAALANVILTHYMANFGDISVAAFGIVQKIGSVIFQITVGLTQGIMPMLGFSYGAKHHDRVRSILRYSVLILGIYSILAVALLELFASGTVRLFTGEPETIRKGAFYLRIWMIRSPCAAFVMLFCSTFQALGKWRRSLILSLIQQVILQIPMLIILFYAMGELGLVLAQPAADAIAIVIALISYLTMAKKMGIDTNDRALS